MAGHRRIEDCHRDLAHRGGDASELAPGTGLAVYHQTVVKTVERLAILLHRSIGIREAEGTWLSLKNQ